MSDEPPSRTTPSGRAWTRADLGVEGRVLEVVRAPAPVLAPRRREVDPTAPDVVQLAADLVATMRVVPGCVGLAAPQVGVAAQVFCVDVSEPPEDPRPPRHVRAVQRRGRGVVAATRRPARAA